MGLPVVDSVSPSSGPITGGTAVTILGRNFTGVTSVSFNGTPAASFTVVDDNTITAVTPVSSSGPVVLVNADGSSEDPFPSVMVDSSGVGNDVLYNPYGTSVGIVVEVPGLVAGDDAASIAGSAGVNPIGGNAPLAPGFGTGDIFMCGWMQTDTLLAESDVPVIAQLGTGGGLFGFAIYLVFGPSPNLEFVAHHSFHDSGSGLDVDDGFSETGVGIASVTLDTDPHFYAVTYEAATATYTAYFDGTAVGTATGLYPGIAGLESDTVDYIGSGATAVVTFDEVAWGPALLSSTDIADLYAAAGDFSTYNALMLSFAPTGYYHLDETRGGSGEFTYSPLGGYLGMVGGPNPWLGATSRLGGGVYRLWAFRW